MIYTCSNDDCIARIYFAYGFPNCFEWGIYRAISSVIISNRIGNIISGLPKSINVKNKKQSNAIRLPRFVRIIVPEMRIAETTSHVVVFPNPANAVFSSMYGVSDKASANTNTLRAINTSGAIANGRRINPRIVELKIAKILQPVTLRPLGGFISQRIVAKTTQITNRPASDIPMAVLTLWWEERLNMVVA